jgi:LPS O-antigen subunit length determinant protein (WzzB/FepE family)
MDSILFIATWAIIGIFIGGVIVLVKAKFKK